MSIAKKIWICIAVLAAGYLATASAGFVLGWRGEGRLNAIGERLFPASLLAQEASDHLDEALRFCEKAYLDGDKDAPKNAKAKANAAVDSERKLGEMTTLIERTKAAESVAARIGDFLKQYEKTFVDASNGNSDAATLAGTKGMPMGRAILASAKELIAATGTDLKSALEAEQQNSKNQRYVVLIACCVLLIAALAATARVVQIGVVRPLRRVAGSLTDIGSGTGDLTARIVVPNRGDEIAVLAGGFNTFVEKLQSTVRQVAESATRVGEATQELGTTASQLSHLAEGGRTQSADLSGVIAKLQETMQYVAASATELAASVKTLAEGMNGASQLAHRTAEQVRSADSVMDRLTTSAEEIGTVVQMINDIARRTNLLALNATIEAARAGAAGKGFAVVASEVKDLAQQTAAATGDIVAKVKSIQAASHEARQAMTAATGSVDEATSAQASMAAAVEQQDATTREIAMRMEQAAQASSNAVKLVGDLAAAAEQTAQAAVAVQATNDRLGGSAATLGEAVGRFRA